MSTETYILTGTARDALESLLDGLDPITEATPAREQPARRELQQVPVPVHEFAAVRNRMWAMRDYPDPPEGLVKILAAAIVSWEQESSSPHTSVEAATTFRACAWELRQILKDFPEQTAQITKEQTR
ncbi:hypothetical protein BO226_19395 [Rhodococcus sp. 2G]|uniref:hypothetical protein n=1 Tax=Rhodococcus sp. 2G TaxID=1570939 RepID=UPI0009042B37|nr:hypothetical protein [Rhodococcus sp. 2G]APE11040.1 hypothetical protein BO226_19065 [Rhodococcus sp. 2G]APE11096.1 hypothetical protein BO226_19395 [Rhodococcus sp. 2G]